MPDLPNRRERENQLAVYLLLLWDDFRFPYERSGAFNLSSFRDRLSSGLVDPLAKTYEASGRQLAEKYNLKMPGFDAISRRWATDYARKLAEQIASTTADLERQAREAIARGEITREEAAKTIFSPARVENIAITETTNAATYGEQPPVEIYNAATDSYLTPIWYTEQDALVCEVCGPLHGVGPQVFGKVSISGPPAHPRCVLPGTSVISLGKLQAAAKSFYIGRCVDIGLGNGSRISVTENHPILTPWGWIRAKFLDEGMEVIRATDFERIAAAVNPHNDNGPALIEEVFGSFVKSGRMASYRVPPSSEDFYGDGGAIHGEIYVVGPHGPLMGHNDPALYQHRCQQFFRWGDMQPLALHCGGGFDSPLNRLRYAARGSMAAIKHRTSLPVGGVRPAHLHATGTITGVDPGLEQAIPKSPTIDSSLARKFVLRFAGLIASEKIVKVRNFDYSGHVFDLQCGPYELYSGNGVIVKNCRCWLEYELEGTATLAESFDPAPRRKRKQRQPVEAA